MLNKLIDIARHIRRSERFKNSISTPGRISLHAQQRLNRGYFAIEIRAHSGFFSVMQMVLFILTVFVAYAYVWRRGGLEWD